LITQSASIAGDMNAHLAPPQKACSVLGRFLHYRGLTLVSEPLRPGHVTADDLADGLTPVDLIKSILDTIGRWEITAKDGDGVFTHIVVLTSQSAETRKAKELDQLIRQAQETVTRGDDRAGHKNSRLGELILIVPQDVVNKQALQMVVNTARADISDMYLGFYSYAGFSTVVPESEIFPPHTVASPEEVATYLGLNYITRNDLAIIHSHDPGVIWCGARRGQVVKVMRASETAGERFPVYRMVR
jgi:DNA-directed RNA polymerase subunit H (RpoH/RPB5)